MSLFEQKKGNENCTDITANQEIKDKTTIWWEPENWTSPSETEAQLKITFNNPEVNPDKLIRFKLESRELKASAQGKDPMKGSDVLMLERMLWHLGMSPSGSPGYLGSALTKSASKKYLSSTPSVGNMMGRFNYINFGHYNESTNKYVGVKGPSADKETSNTTSAPNKIAKLGEHWHHYMMTHTERGTAKFTTDDLTDSEWDAAVAIFDGGNIGYSSKYQETPVSFNYAPTYTKKVHEDYFVEKGIKKEFKRKLILKAMAQKESFHTHMGFGGDNHQIIVGGGDELGSKGFNQIQNVYTYGMYSARGSNRGSAYCSNVTSYRLPQHGLQTVVNHYDPAENIKAKAAWLAAQAGDCGKSFRWGFHLNWYGKSFQSQSATLRAIDKGVGYELVTGTHTDDTYEILAKSIGGYNQGAGVYSAQKVANLSWADLLIDPQSRSKKKLKTTMEYTLDILTNKTNHIGLTKRKYLWYGGKGFNVNGDEEIKNVLDNPDTPEDESVNEEDVDWCFQYGESEWLDGKKTWEQVKGAADSYDLAGRIQEPVGQLTCE